MLWYFLIGYIVLSEIIVLSALVIGFLAKDCPRDEEFESRMEQFEALGAGRKTTSLVVMGLLWTALAPVVAPLLLFLLFRCMRASGEEVRYWQGIRATHHDLVLDAVHPENIPADLAANIEQNSPILESLGYELLGTWWLKPEPFNSQAMFYLHPDGVSLAEIGCTLKTCYGEVTSYLEDGSMVSTVNCDSFDTEKFAAHGYYIQFCPGLEMTDLVAAHESFLQDVANQLAVPVRCLAADNWKQYTRYQNRRFSHIKFEIGEAHEPVDCPFPTARVAQPSSTPAIPETIDSLSRLVQDS